MDYYFITLAVLFLVMNIFWAIVCHKLINKLMSKNYYEYKVSETISDKKERKRENRLEAEDFGSLHEILA